MGWDSKYGEILAKRRASGEAPRGVGSEDEPLFILRGQDKLVVPLIRLYAAVADTADCQPGFVEIVKAEASRIEHWQAKNKDRVKIPD